MLGLPVLSATDLIGSYRFSEDKLQSETQNQQRKETEHNV